MRALIASALLLSGCATDIWSDTHHLEEFKRERLDIELKREHCENGLKELWQKFNGLTEVAPEELKRIHTFCKKSIEMPQAPNECRTWRDDD